MVILDTDALTHFSRGNEEIKKRWEQALQDNPDETLVITVVTWFEAI